jgi:hypothetical protein
MKKLFLLFAMALFLFLNVQGQVAGDFRSKPAGTGNWNDFNAWERYDGTNWLAATSGQLPTATSATTIQAGHSMVINALALTSGNLTVSGSLTYHATTVSALTVSGNVTVTATGSFTSPSSGTVVTHALNIGGSTATGVGGNLVVDGVFNMNAFSTAGVVVTFYGTSNNTISGAGSTINFYSIVVNKGTSQASILDVTSVISCADATSTAGLRLLVTIGTFKLSSASTLSPFYGSVQPTQPNNARIWLNNNAATIKSVGAGTSGGATGTLSFGGMLQIDAGTLAHGNGTSSISIFGNFSMGGPNAILNVYGYFYSGSASTYTITAGNINIYPQVGANFVAPIFFSQLGLFHFGGSALNFTGGTLTIVDANLAVTSGSNFAPYSINISAGTNNLAGSTIRFGDGTSDLDGSVNGFTINSGTPLGNVIVNNNPASVKTTRYVKTLTNLTIGGNLTINSGSANQFLVNGFMLTSRGNITNSGTLTFDVAAPGNTTSGLTFTGTTQQTVGGTGTFSTNVNNLVINNTSGASPAVDLQIPLSVSNGLTLTKGILGSSNSSAFTIGKTGYPTFALTRSGGSLASLPTFALGGVTTFNVIYSAPSPVASITTGVELPASQQVTTFTVSNASGVTLDKPVSCTTLALTSGILSTTSTNSITVTGPAITNITGGSATAYVNGPLTRTIPNTASAANYKFHVGKTAYQLFEYSSITTGGTGTATFTAEAFDAGPFVGTAGTGLSSINTNKYWSLSASLGSVTITSSTVRLTDAGLVSTNRIGQSNTALGTYNSIGGTVVGGTTISSASPIDYSAISTGTNFRIGQANVFAAGIYAIGPQASYAGYGATFASLTAAVSAITAVPLPGHVIFEFQTDYNPSVEATTVSMTSSIASNATSTVTFRPAASVSSVINFSKAVSIINNAGADYITFDGRNGGIGTNKFLQFTNTATTSSAVTLSTDAQYNQILYCVLKGSTTSASTGILTINGATAGNNFYTIDNCIFDASGLANNCIYSTGIASDAIIKNSNFFDFRNGAGINLASGSNNALIDNNNFYQTTTYNGFAGTTYGIYVASGNNCQISNNNIGGSGPGVTGTWTVSATTPAAYNFTGIYASLATTSKIFNNKIQNFDWKSTPATWTGINGSGTVNIGGDGANFVGNNTGNGNITITYFTTNSAAVVNGMLISGTSVTVANNYIGSITTLLSGATGIGSSIYGISTSATTAVISNNIIGSATTPQSINAANQSTIGNTQNIYGINITSNGALNISGNTIANLYNGMTFSSATSGLLRGIKSPGAGGGSITISSNNIFSLSTPQPMTGAISFGSSNHSIVGIDLNSTNATVTSVTGNTIYDLSNTAASAAVSVLGIYCQSGANSVFEGNYIHSISTVSSTAVQTGFNLNYGGPCTIKNNVIRLGFDYAGNSITSNAQINGIIKNTGNGFPCYAYFNTVYIGGSGVTAGTAATYCFNVTLHVTEDIRDNIFVNTRSGGGTNYAIKVMGTGVAPSGLTMNYNDYFVSGTGSMFGYYNANIADLAAWKTAVGLDVNSISVDPLFTSPTNLTITNTALVAGTPISGITTDFGGSPRNATTPTIGAYEYLTATTIAVNSPTITYGTASVNLTGTVTPNPGSGTIQFFNNGTLIGTAAVDPGTGIGTLSYTTSALNVGAYMIRANYGGNAAFAASTTNPASNGTLTVTKANQTITFNPLSNVTKTTPPFNLTATASSGLPVSYSTSNPFVAFISGSTVTPFNDGTTNITASQPGNANYNAATDVIQPLTVASFKTVNLTLFLEGLYIGGGMMSQAWNATGPQYGPSIADVVSVDLHDPVTFATIHYTLNNVEISTSGTVTLLIPGIYNGTYYLSLHHRNSIETITGLPVSFNTSIVNYDFTTSASQSFGNNMKQMTDGKWAFYGGDANIDGVVDGIDLIGVENDAAAFSTGYILSDANGDGVVDGLDLILIENNASGFVQVITP